MKNLFKLRVFCLILLFGIFLVSCEKQDLVEENKVDGEVFLEIIAQGNPGNSLPEGSLKSTKSTGWNTHNYQYLTNTTHAVAVTENLKVFNVKSNMLVERSIFAQPNDWHGLGFTFNDVVDAVAGEGPQDWNKLFILANSSIYSYNTETRQLSVVGSVGAWPKYCTQAVTYLDGYLYIQHYDNSIFKVNVNTGSYRSVGPRGLWPNASTVDMASCNGFIYILTKGCLYKISPADDDNGSFVQLGPSGAWPYDITKKMCKMAGKLYILHKYPVNWNVYEVNPDNGSWIRTDLSFGNDNPRFLTGTLRDVSYYQYLVGEANYSVHNLLYSFRKL
jgi:hypothetical protein